MNQNPKGHGYFRKSKAYGLVCGIALAGALMVSTQANADELVEVTPAVTITANPATNLPEAQPETPAVNTALANEAGTQTGEMVSDVVSPTLDQAVTKATDAGVSISTESKVTYDSLEKAQADLAKQEVAIKEATTKQEANTTAIASAEAQNKAIDKANADEKARVDALNKQGEADVKARNEAGQKAVEAENAKAKADADKKNAELQADFDQKVVDRQKIIDDNAAENERFNKEWAAFEKARLEFERADKIYQEALKAQVKAKEKQQTNDNNFAQEQAKYQKALEEFKITKEKYDKALEDFKKKYAKYLEDVKKQEVIAEENKAIELKNRENQEYNRQIMTDNGLTYTGDYDVDLRTVADFNNRNGRTTITEENRQKWDDAVTRTSATLPDGGSGYTPSGSSTMLPPVILSNGVEIVGKGVLEQGQSGVVIRGDVDPSKVIKEVYWGNVTPEGFGLRENYYGHQSSGWGYVYNYSIGNPSQVWIGKTRTWYRIPNLITTMDNRVHDGYVMFDVDASGLHNYYDGTEVAFWNSNGAINAVNGATADGNVNQQSDAIRTVISLDSPNNNDSDIIWVAMMSDLDGGQFLDDSQFKVLGVGGGMSTTSYNRPASDEELGFTYGKNKDDNALNGYNSSPDGTILFVQNGMYSISLRNTPGGRSSLTARADFGAGADIDKTIIKITKGKTIELKPIMPIEHVNVIEPQKPTPPTPPTPPEKKPPVPIPSVPDKLDPPKPPTPPNLKVVPPVPDEPEFVTPVVKVFKPDVYVPIKPNEKPYVNVPNKENHKAKVHPVEVKQNPVNVKDVVNGEGVSINGQLVPKGHLAEWKMTNTPLKAGRDQVTSYEMSDPLPAGFVLDKEATEKKNPSWVLATDEAGRLSIFATPATLDLFNKDRSKDVAIPVVTLVGRPMNDGGTYENTFKTIITTPKGKYTTTSNTPVIYTPGRDPKTPRPPRPEDPTTPPTPNDNLIQPKKDVVDEKGLSINGKQVLPNTPINYVLTQDFDQYKGMIASKEAIGKGFIYVDDYLDEALDGKSMVVKSITAKNGDDVSNLLDMYHVLSKDSLDERLAELVKVSGISPVGEFYMWVAKDPEAFFKAYVQKGLDITYNLSFKIKDKFVGKFTNQTYQLDFGNGYYSNVVTNEVPELKVNKDVVIDGKAVDKGEVKLGDTVEYVLEGWVIPADRGYDVKEYRFVDVMQSSHDDYKGFSAKANVDITLADGTVIKKGTDLSEYVVQTYDVKTGKFELTFKDEFLAQIPRSSAFGSDVILKAQRILAGTVENEFTLYVNGIPVKSDKVITETPEPPKPPTPVTPPVPKAKKELPKTGDSSSLLALVGTVLSGFGLVGLKRRKKD
ncbi:UNVERIFIED_CONTAM: LPXTG cell wall anchor domain-containing protein [Streptococcus canis]